MSRMTGSTSRVLRVGWLVVVAAIVGACTDEAPPPPPPPPSVQIAEVLQRDVPIYVENIGQTRGSTEIEIRARVEGILDGVHFREGGTVKEGDLLYTIDPKPFEAALAENRGKLAEAQAQFARASQDVARYKPLVAQNAISRQEYETSVALADAAKATAEAARAAVQSAQLDLGYTKIFSPTDGLAGKTEVNPGNLVGRGQNTLLTTISKVDPIRVRASLSERDYLRFARARLNGGDAAKEKSSDLELVLADGSVHDFKGAVVFADRLVDPTTGTLLIEAEFPNPDLLLRPGQYARVRFATETRKGAILVPQRAVAEMQATYSVAVVGADNVATMRTVKPGARVGSLWVIEDGLKPGERVVVEGLQKVRPGITVSPTVVKIQDETAKPVSAASTAE